ncbi:MAG: hypothetical protein GX638_02095 [Crenarchaeota archaeon]|nr:hypothetical protein [Thermoproteota archaeon]
MKNKNKKVIIIPLSLLLLLSMFFAVSAVSTSYTVSASRAFIQYGTMDYAEYNATLMGGTAEKILSSDVATYIYSMASSAGYDYCKDYWGNRSRQTQPYTVYDEASICENTYDSTVVYYKGHSWEGRCPYYPTSCTLMHYGIYDCEGYNASSLQIIKDFEIHNSIHNQGSGTHDFVFLWTCGAGNPSVLGSNNGGVHSHGMCASWLDIQYPFNVDLSYDGYAYPDDGGRCFISFFNISLWYTQNTNYGSWNYGHFIYYFFNSAFQPNTSINQALDFASRATHNGIAFGQSELYCDEGYEILDPRDGQPVWSCMMVYGDGSAHLIN